MNAILAYDLLKTLTRKECNDLAKVHGVKVGKSKEDTIANLHASVINKKLAIKAKLEISAPRTLNYAKGKGLYSGPTIIGKKLRSYRKDKTTMPIIPTLLQKI